MRHVLPRALALAALLALPAAALAQVQTTGTLMGHVFDQSGAPIRGVKVTVSSPTQIGGPRSTFTNDEGAYRFAGLSPGRFEVVATAPKLNAAKVPDVRITPGGVAEIDLVMEVAGAVEEVRIVEKAPVINTATATVGESFDAEFVDQLPLSTRDYQGVMALAPGVTDIFGTGNPNVRGGTFFNNSYTVDGFQTTDPVTHTFGTNFSFNAMAAVEVQTAAFGAEHSATAGGMTNIVTKSGSNRFEFDTTLTYTDDNLQFFRDARDRGSNRQAVLSLDLGGPIIRDQLWFYLSGQGINTTFSLPDDPLFPDHPPFSILAFDGLGKLTWQATPRNKLELMGILSPADFQNTVQSYLVEPEAESRSIQGTRFLGLSWYSALTDRHALVMRAGVREVKLETEPQSCKWDPENCSIIPSEVDIVSGIQRRNASAYSKDFRRSVETSGSFNWYRDTRRFGNHDVRLGARFQGHLNPSAQTVPGDAVNFFAGSERYAQQQYCANDPKLSNGECRPGWIRSVVTGQEVHGFLHDAWKPTRYLTVTPGVAVHYGHSEDDQERTVTDTLAFTPHLQSVWDITHDGRTVVRASFNNNVDTGFLALARFTSRELYRKTCFWDPEARAYIRNCRSSGGASSTTVGKPCGPDGLNPDGTSCQTELRAPRVWEYTFGAEREVMTGVTLGADLVYRKFVHQWEDLETNANWNRGGTGLRREGSWKTGRSEFVYDLETPDEAQRRYLGVTGTIRKREGLLKLLGSYTWTRYEGTDDSSFASSFLDNPGQTPYYYGPLGSDYRHQVKLQATYQFRPWLSGGVTYEFLSGGPYDRYGYDPEFQSFTAFQTKRGYDHRGTLNPDDDTPLRLPDLSQLALQARLSLRQFTKQDIDIFGDLLNLMALRTTTSVLERDGPLWGRPLSRLPPTRLRLGVRYRF